jgi:hypothetical protein
LKTWRDVMIQVERACGGHSVRAIWGVVVRPLACWNGGFESRRKHGCLSMFCLVR